jgi:ferric-dicitrate binding protein FerR (iron transport regulator)
MRKKELYRLLVERYLNRTASTEELQTFFHLLEQGKLKKQLLEATQDAQERSIARVRHVVRRYSVAAVLVGLVGLGVFFLRRAGSRKDEVPAFVSVYKNDIDPGRDRAVVTLANGSRVTLDHVEDYGRLKGEKRPLYRSLSTPAGGQYRLILADGTKVWLNSQSSIRFPTAFTGPTRFVEVSGEAYFDVARDARKPFLVKAGNLTVQALGTQFNIHAYPDEASAKATLIQGSVRVIKDVDSILLAPGEEGQSDKGLGLVLNGGVDTSQTAAWKDGYFDFDNLDIQAIMRQFARWYDIQVVFEGKPSTAPFAGKMQRSLRLSQVMIGLGKMGVHSRLEGRVLSILP